MPALPPSQTRSVSLPLPLPLTIGRRWIHESVKKVRLLVDGDVFGSSQVCDAMEYLAKQFGDVSALVFAAPGIVNDKNMNELSRRSEVSCVPIPRAQNQAAEPNDDAIISEIQKCAKSPRGACVALFTNDKGFASVIKHSMSDKHRFYVLIKSTSFAVADFYKEQGIPVLTLPVEARLTTVKAILHPDGDGTVELGEAIDPSANRARRVAMYDSWEELLKGQGCSASFSSSGGYPVQRIAKFWFANSLGSLCVFPLSVGTFALNSALRQRPRKWISDTESFALVVPVRRGKSKSQLNKYGSRLGCSIFLGGGPFMLQDSGDLVAQALKKLGYLDDSWNTDLTEALNCFWNATNNKHVLRKLGFLIDPLDTASDAAAKLRTALLSDSTNGLWQRGGTCTHTAITILRSKNLLPRSSKSPAMDETWSAMKTYAKVHQLPKMKTFNALAAQITRHSNQTDPSRRGTIIIKG